MKIDATLATHADGTRAAAAELEAAGYDGLWVGETKHDPFLGRAGRRRHRALVTTAVAIAFARSPMTLAHRVGSARSRVAASTSGSAAR